MSKMILSNNNRHYSNFCLLLLLFLDVALFFQKAKAQPMNNGMPPRNSVTAIFVFGDSTSDSGNNNYISTTFKSNFPPYGRDFFNHIPTGRFSNGRLGNDFIAKYLGIKDSVPPYLDPNLRNDDLMTGVSFASAGSGFDPLTPQIGVSISLFLQKLSLFTKRKEEKKKKLPRFSIFTQTLYLFILVGMQNVISLSKQLEYLKDYQSKMEALIGEEQTQELIRNALFLVSAGTNDFVVNYLTIPIRRKKYTIPAYTDFCLEHVDQFIQGLWDLGARRIGVVGLPPMGCLPIVITLYSNNALGKRSCIDAYSSIARTYNQKLQLQLKNTQTRLAGDGSRIAYLDSYGALEAMTSQGQDYDFDEVSSGCCGSGWLEASFLCNPKSYICPDASKYVFWDAIHPTEKAYYILFQTVRPVIDSIVQD